MIIFQSLFFILITSTCQAEEFRLQLVGSTNRGLRESTPDCLESRNKDTPHCICRLPLNRNSDACLEYHARHEVKNNIFSTHVGRIINGNEVRRGKYPWFARAVNHKGGWGGCGGMLVAPEYVLTAAHCIGAFNGGFQIGALCDPFQEDDNCGQKIEPVNLPREVFKHHKFNLDSLDNDFALVKLETRSSIQPIAMDQGEISVKYDAHKKNLYAVGLGKTKTFGDVVLPNRLRHVKLSYITQKECRESYGINSITDSMLCAADPGQDSCQGDSGGPLYDKENNVVVGVVSLGWGCADSKYPGVYARISKQWNWIKETICITGGHSDPKPEFCSGTPAPTSSLAPTFPTHAPTPQRLCENPNEGLFELEIKTDGFAAEDNSFIVRERGPRRKFRKGVYRGIKLPNKQDVKKEKCMDRSRCYKLFMKDAYGDGMCCQHGKGSYIVKWNGIIIKDSKFKGGYREVSKKFGNC